MKCLLCSRPLTWKIERQRNLCCACITPPKWLRARAEVDQTGECRYYTWTFPASMVPEGWQPSQDEQIPHTIRMALLDSGINPDGKHCQHSYDCCGSYYSSGAYMAGGRGSVVLVKQSWHQNV